MGYGKAWEVRESILTDLIANADKKGNCRIQVWSEASDNINDCRLCLRVLLGWVDTYVSALRSYNHENRQISDKSNSTKKKRFKIDNAKAWSVPASKLQQLIEAQDSAGNCKIQVWHDTSDKVKDCDLYLGLVSGWVDSFTEITPIDSTATD